MRSLTTFLTATGFLLAISLVWGQWWVQLWVQPYKVADLPVLLGLAWSYISVFSSLIAFGWAAASNIKSQTKYVGNIPLSLVITAFFMTLFNVGQSVLSSITRLLWQTSLADLMLNQEHCTVAWTLVMIVSIAVLFLIIYLLVARTDKGRDELSS